MLPSGAERGSQQLFRNFYCFRYYESPKSYVEVLPASP